MKKISLFLFFTIQFIGYSQDIDTLSLNNSDIIPLEEVFVFGKEPIFKTEEDRNRYLILKYRVKKVYPYAKLAAEELQRINKVLDSLPNNRQKKKYTKKIQEETENKFSQELKKLSRSQGRILIKLIHRQTGRTAYNLVKELRNGWNAYWYNKTAWLYDLSLKKEYDPHNVEEDYWIEEIILRAINRGELEPQVPALRFNFTELTEERKKRLSDN